MRVGILGCDSSHAEEYTALINLFGFGTIDFLWDPNEQTLKSKQNLICAKHASTNLPPVLRDLDLVLVEGRYAESHLKTQLSFPFKAKFPPTLTNQPVLLLLNIGST